jgi:hypothetical protein
MSETIWRATDLDGKCWHWSKEPTLDGNEFNANADWMEYLGAEKPPPGECVEYGLTRKGEQPSGEAWERLVEACREYTNDRGSVYEGLAPIGRAICDAWKAYEAAQSAELIEPPEPQKPAQPSGTPMFIESDDYGVLYLGTKHPADSRRSDWFAIGEIGKVTGLDWIKPNESWPMRLVRADAVGDESQIDQQGVIERLTKERDEARAEAKKAVKALEEQAKLAVAAHSELANERASGNRAIAERDATIAELETKLERQEMPDCVRELCNIAYDAESFQIDRRQAVKAVEAHYAQSLKFEVGGIYIREPYGHDELELLKILDDRMLFYLRSYSEVAWTNSKGETNGWKIIKRVR